MTMAMARVAPRGQVAVSAPVKFVLLTFGCSWSVLIGGWLLAGRPADFHAPGMVAAVYLSSFGPGLAAAILSAREGRFRAWASGFARWRAGWRAYLAALLPLPLAIVALTWALGYSPRPGASGGMPATLFWLTLFPVSLFNGIATALMGAGPLGEEGGWRGYLLPRLLERTTEPRAALIVGVIWALWHLPIMALFAGWRDGLPFGFYLPAYVVGVVGLSFLLTRVWRLGGGSLLPCIWLHGLVNAIGGTAFNGTLWTSRWSPEASTAHAMLAFWVAAGVVWAVTAVRRRQP